MLCTPEGAAASSLPLWHAGIESSRRGGPRPALDPDMLPLFPRCGLALALNKLSQCLDSSQVKPLFQFFVPDALNDRNPDVRKCMLDAALATLNAHGKVSRLSQCGGWGEGWARAGGRSEPCDTGRLSARRSGRVLAPMENFISLFFEPKGPLKGVKFF